MTPTFRVIDKQTGREYSEKNINTDGLMTMDLYQMFLGEDGYLVMADDCDRMAYQDRERFDVVIDGYVAIDKVLEIIEEAYFGAGQSEIDYHSRLIEGIGLLEGGAE